MKYTVKVMDPKDSQWKFYTGNLLVTRLSPEYPDALKMGKREAWGVVKSFHNRCLFAEIDAVEK